MKYIKDLYDAIKQKNKIFFLIMVLIFALLYIFNNLNINNDVSTASGGVQEEFIMEYLTGKNFALKGFSRLYFLPDQSTDFQKNSQPLFYTHNPPLPSLVQGLIIKMGFNIFQSRIIYIFISLTGLAFLYLFVANIASISAAVISSIFLIINFNGFLSFIDHNHYAMGFPLLFIYLWAYSLQSSKKYLIISIIFLIASWISYAFLSFMIILGFLFFIFDKNKKLFIYSVLLAVTGISLHIIQNIIALSPVVAWQDLWLTIQNRIYNTPTRQELLNFYQNHNLALWGGYELAASQSISSYFQSAMALFILFKTPIIIAAVSAFILCLKRQGNFYKNRMILIPAFLAFFIWHAGVELTIGVYPPIFHIFLSIFLGIILSDLLSALQNDYPFAGLSFKKIAIKILILCAISLIMFKYFTWAGKISNDESLSNLLNISEKYKGKTFFTNIFMPNTISFKTDNWVVGGCLPDGLLNLDASLCYSKATSLPKEKIMPDYILLSTQSFAFDCSGNCYENLRQKLIDKYESVDDINKSEIIIFKVKK